jgi:hypothetical protein
VLSRGDEVLVCGGGWWDSGRGCATGEMRGSNSSRQAREIFSPGWELFFLWVHPITLGALQSSL